MCVLLLVLMCVLLRVCPDMCFVADMCIVCPDMCIVACLP